MGGDGIAAKSESSSLTKNEEYMSRNLDIFTIFTN
jgi:hypothetical protein